MVRANMAGGMNGSHDLMLSVAETGVDNDDTDRRDSSQNHGSRKILNPIMTDEAKRSNDESDEIMLPECLEIEKGVTSVNDGSVLWTMMQRRDSQNELALEEEQRKTLLESNTALMFGPESDFRMKWDLTQFGLLVYIAIFVPWRIGFSQSATLWSFAFFVDLFVDLYFICKLTPCILTSTCTRCLAIIWTVVILNL
jgi:hypothetical protein